MHSNPPPSTPKAWRLQDAKAQFSELVDKALRGVPQHVTRRGKQAVVVLSEADFATLQRNTGTQKPSGLIEHLLAIPKRSAGSASKKHPAESSEFTALEVQPREIDFS